MAIFEKISHLISSLKEIKSEIKRRVSLVEINKRLSDYSTLSKVQIEIMQKETQEKYGH